MVNYEYDRDGYVVVYADGACLNNGQNGAQAGIGVYFGYNHDLNVCEPVKGRATNNMAEIQAVTRAAEIALQNGISRLCIYTDSKYVIGCLDWMNRLWRNNGWRTVQGGHVKNQNQLRIMDAALGQLQDVHVKHVAAHSGNYGNDRADELAKHGATHYQSFD